MTHHPYTTTSIWFPKDAWVDMNGIQGSRNENPDNNLMVYARVACECNKTDPMRPALFLEGSYEDERNNAGKLPPTTPRNVRMQAWYAFFAGAAGYSYGHVDNWDSTGHVDDLDSPAALQMGRAAAISRSAGMVEAHAGPDDPAERRRERREAKSGGSRGGPKRGLHTFLPHQRTGGSSAQRSGRGGRISGILVRSARRTHGGHRRTYRSQSGESAAARGVGRRCVGD